MESTQRFFRAKPSVAFICAVVLFSLHSVNCLAQADQEDLRAEVKALLERVRVLEAEVETLKSAQAGTVPSAPPAINAVSGTQLPVMVGLAPQPRRSTPILGSSAISWVLREEIESIRCRHLRCRKARSRSSRLSTHTHGPTSSWPSGRTTSKWTKAMSPLLRCRGALYQGSEGCGRPSGV